MSTFLVENGHFRIDGRPQIIQAGEFHYFRTPADQWRHRLSLLVDAGFNAVAAYMPWLWHQLEQGVSDFDGHSHPMRDLAGFLDLAAEMGLWVIARPGPYIMAESINEGIPPWVFARYPQAAFVSQDGQVQNVASYLHPDFLACVRDWYRAIFAVLAPRQITRGGKIILVQLDNEMGMIPWVRNILDTNPDTLRRFAAHVQAVYGADLPARYPAGPLEEILKEGLVHPDRAHSRSAVEDYRRFYRDYLREYMAFLWDEARACGLEVPPVVNIHGFANGGKTFTIGLSQLIGAMELDGMVSATDVYPITIGEGNYAQLLLVNEMTKALHNPQQPLFSIEFQAGGNQDFSNGQSSFFDLHTRLCLSNGMRAINHYLFFDGENDPVLSPTRRHDWGHPVRKDGSLRRHYRRYPQLSRALHTYGEALTLAEPETVATLGFRLDDFMTEVSTAATQEDVRAITHQREVLLFDFIGRGLALTHRPFEALELARAALDSTRTPLLWAMLDRTCDRAIQQKLVGYLHAGGRLALLGRLPAEDEFHRPCTLLQEALGVREVRTHPPFHERRIRAFDIPELPVSFLETYRGAFEEIFAVDEHGEAAGFVARCGSGQALLLGAALAANTLEDLAVFERIAQRMDNAPLFELSDWADVRLSRNADGTAFLFLNNYQDDPVETAVALRGAALFGGLPVHLPARSGLILPLEWQAHPQVRVHWCTAEVNGLEEMGELLVLLLRPAVFSAELSLAGWVPDPALEVEPGAAGRIRVHGKDGRLVLRRPPG